MRFRLRWLFLYLPLLVIAIFLAIGFYFSKRWGKDDVVASSTVVSEQKENLSFAAKRNQEGVWTIEAQSIDSIWFAMGYLQTWDREFQLDLVRYSATGRLAEIFGERALPRDRLMRFLVPAAKEEWNRLPKDSLVAKAILGFLEGRRAFLKNPKTTEPMEYKVFQLTRAAMEEWQPWELLAISRFHAWTLADDIGTDRRRAAIRAHLGTDYAKFFSLARHSQGTPLYAQSKFLKTQNALGGLKTKKTFQVDYPEDFLAQLQSPSNSSHALAPLWPDLSVSASNSWIVSHPQTALLPSLCIDPHLGTSWPSALYPVNFHVKNSDHEISSLGFAMPGLPAVVIGQVNRFDVAAKKQSSLVWGITIANFADAQDLVSLNAQTLKQARSKKERFKVRDIQKGITAEQEFVATWTAFGPRVDEFFSFFGAKVTQNPLALDWIGFRKGAVHPLEFFLRRNTQAAQHLHDDWANRWDFPNVNYVFLEKSTERGIRHGHHLTGAIFSRENRENDFGILDELQAQLRELSLPSQRPYLDEAYHEHKPWFLVSANQFVFANQKLNEKLAYHWTHAGRAETAFASVEKKMSPIEATQSNYYSRILHQFVKRARARLDVNRLCAVGGGEAISKCTRLISALDAWDGVADKNKWEPTVAALWLSKAKLSLWPSNLKIKEKGDLNDLYKSWNGSSMTEEFMEQLMQQDALEKQLKKLTGKSLVEHLELAFVETLKLLDTQLGPMTSAWVWGRVHQIRWMHPFRFIPEPMGELLSTSTLGPPPAVSGYFDSPAQMTPDWDPRNPTQFPVVHAPCARICSSLKQLKSDEGGFAFSSRWSNITGVSGNPLSKWAWPMALNAYFEDKLVEP